MVRAECARRSEPLALSHPDVERPQLTLARTQLATHPCARPAERRLRAAYQRVARRAALLRARHGAVRQNTRRVHHRTGDESQVPRGHQMLAHSLQPALLVREERLEGARHIHLVSHSPLQNRRPAAARRHTRHGLQQAARRGLRQVQNSHTRRARR